MEALEKKLRNELEVIRAKSWIHATDENGDSFTRRDGVVLKRTKNTYINSQITYWAGTLDQPRGAQLRLVQLTPTDTPRWDFDNPEQCIELRSSEIKILRDFLNEEFRKGGIGHTYWLSVSDETLAMSLERFLGGNIQSDTDIHQLADVISIRPELISAILDSDQVTLEIELRERNRRVGVLDTLEGLIAAEDTSELTLQKVIENNPWIFGGEVSDAAELRNITSSEQIDIPVIRGDGSMVVVELKRAAAAKIATSDRGYPVLSGEVNLAVQQAQRYLYELDRLADTLLAKHQFDARRATALVVIGLTPNLEGIELDKFNESFRIYNSHLARVQVTTYDNLLANARRLLELGDLKPENT